MSAFSRLHKATAIMPLAVLSAAWTASLAGMGVGSAVADDAAATLPDGTTVPTPAIEAPASVSSPTSLPPPPRAVTPSEIIATASTSGIPQAALAAYQRAEAVINSADKCCEIPWELIAAIGRVESDHGRFGGNTLDDEGVAQPGIYGIALNGKNNTQNIIDTDAGQYDSDTSYDRAVGPMQFIPSTWSVVGVDGDNDGKRNPQDIDDAALATAVYLCSGDDDLSTDQGQRASVYRYNHSNDYVDLVISIMQAYMDGDFTSVPNGTTSAGVFLPNTTGATTAPDAHRQGQQGQGQRPSSRAAPRRPTRPRSRPRRRRPRRPHRRRRRPTRRRPRPRSRRRRCRSRRRCPRCRPPASRRSTRRSPSPRPTAQCVASGISALDLPAMNACIDGPDDAVAESAPTLRPVGAKPPGAAVGANALPSRRKPPCPVGATFRHSDRRRRRTESSCCRWARFTTGPLGMSNAARVQI